MREGTKRRHMPVAQIILLVLLPLAAYVGVQLYRATSSTYAYENAFITNNYGYSSAVSILIFAILILFSMVTSRKAKEG